MSPAVAREIRNALAGYSETVASAPGATVIAVEPLADPQRFHEAAWKRKNPDPSWAQVDRGEPVAVYRHRQRAGVVVRLGEQLAVEYDDHPSIAKRVVDGILFALQTAVHRRGGLLFKGAVLLKDDGAVGLVGPSGAGKTSLLLHLLAEGWGYLSDDIFLLFDGEAFGLRRYVAFHNHHVLAMPEIFDGVRLSGPRPTRWRAQLRR
ncbi:MAG TPA: hypothetical protein VMS86_15220, partial [Thermoanaerobaculia bacterium]|nr:hypothetical protein [Thermoanaerobaculia bacterium]